MILNEEELTNSAVEITETMQAPIGEGAKRLEDLTLEELRILIAFHCFNDGLEIPEALEIIGEDTSAFNTREMAMGYLEQAFSYARELKKEGGE